jgi:hypothetical protein
VSGDASLFASSEGAQGAMKPGQSRVSVLDADLFG